MRKVFITGSSGYIGQQLTSYLLKKGYQCCLLQNKRSKRLKGKNVNVKYIYYDDDKFDLTVCLKKEKPDVIIHLAGYFVAEHRKEDIEPIIESNITFGVKLLEAMKNSGISRIINTGSFWEEYYQDKVYSPVNLYAACKKAYQDIIQYYVEVWNFSVITLRLYDIYGPNDPRIKIIPILIKHLSSNKILEMSFCEQYLDFVYIDDVVMAYYRAIQSIFTSNRFNNEIVDIGTGKSIQLKSVVRLIEKIYNSKLSIRFGGRPYRIREVMSVKANIEKTKQLIHWKPKIYIEQGLKKIQQKGIYD